MTTRKIFHLANLLDMEAVLNAIMCDTDDQSDQYNCLTEDSDTDYKEHNSERDENSDTVLSAQSTSEYDENETNQSPFKRFKRKKNQCLDMAKTIEEQTKAS